MSFQMYGKTDKEILEAVTFYDKCKYFNVLKEMEEKVKSNLMTRSEAINKIVNKTGCPINQAGDIALALEALGLIKFKETENNSVDTDKVVDQAERYLKGFKLDNESYYLMVQNLMHIIRKHFKTGYRFEHPPKSSPADNWMK